MNVKFVYFRDSGKYYAESEIGVNVEHFYEAVKIIRDMLDNGERPGLVNGYDFHVLATIYTRDGPHQYLHVRAPYTKEIVTEPDIPEI